ncbi:MAG: PEGA domain-containing protein [Myxococcales bacterium]
MTNAGKATVRVESTPPGAMVFFDGQEMGRTPLNIKDIPPGKHLWRVLMPTSEPIGGALTLASGAKEKVSATLGGTAPVSQLIASMIGNKLDDKVLAYAKATAATAAADLLVFGAFFARGQDLVLETFLYSPAKHAVARLPQKTFDTEMLSAGMELFKVAGEIGGRTEELGAAEKMGAKLSAEAPPFASVEQTEVSYAQADKGLDRADDRGPRRPVDPNKNIKNLRPRDK